jgi:uncharacterized protein YndB with AHSA1/START domain
MTNTNTNTETANDTLSVVIERDIPHAPEKIWRALTEPHLLQEWLMNNDFKPIVGQHFRFTADWGSVDCQVLALEPNKTLSYTWRAFGSGTVVTFSLTPTATGTHLRMEHAGFSPSHKQAYQGAQLGWRRFLEALEQVVAKSP